jgi:peptidoglycan/LPS O-acetylase OafA/YrhL
MTALVAPVTGRARIPAPPRPVRRPEIDGLRALAVGLVVGYHVVTGRVSGGVDVFLTLTGFFLVHSLGTHLRGSAPLDPLAPIARTLSRLAPAAFLVVGVTAALSIWVLPETRWREVAEHLIASGTFTENLHLVDEAVEYAADNAAASPMQQFWSLSIQLQVLVAVPLVVCAGAAILRLGGWRRHGRRLVVLLVAAGTVASFGWALAATSADQQAAYFSTLPRLWELGVGALAALLLVGSRPRRRAGAVLGWGGVVALVVCGAVLDGAHAFPGWPALWPVLSAIAVLAAGDSGGRFGVHRVLSPWPMQWLGTRAYGLYLWHWPILVLYLAHADRSRPTAVGAAAIIVLSVLLAALTHRLVEQPAGALLRSRRPAWALVLVVVCAAPLVVAGLGATSSLDSRLASFVPAADDPAYRGARALSGAQPATGGVDDVELLPPLSVIGEDWTHLPDARCRLETQAMQPAPAEFAICTRGPDSASRRIVVVGDSHAAHWLPPLAALADAHDWQVVSVMNPGCNLSTASEFIPRRSPRYEECAAWRSRIVDRIVAFDPDVVVSLGTRIAYGQREVVPPGFVEAWQQLSDRGVPVIGMRDNPRHERHVPDCLAELGDDAPECAVSPSEVYDDEVLDVDLPPGVTLLDTRPYFCTGTVCPAVIGNIRVYMDDAHITAMYMRTVAPLLEPDLLALTGW